MKLKDKKINLDYFRDVFGVLLLLGIVILVWRTKKSEVQLDAMWDNYSKIVSENEILYSYIENVDTFVSLDDAIRHRDNLYDELQFLDE